MSILLAQETSGNGNSAIQIKTWEDYNCHKKANTKKQSCLVFCSSEVHRSKAVCIAYWTNREDED